MDELVFYYISTEEMIALEECGKSIIKCGLKILAWVPCLSDTDWYKGLHYRKSWFMILFDKLIKTVVNSVT